MVVTNLHAIQAQDRAVDSLKAALETMDDRDTMKVDCLFSYSGALLLAKRHAESGDVLNVALALARQQRYESGISRALAGIALKTGNAGDRKRALEILEEARVHARRSPDPQSLMRVYRAKGIVRLQSAQYDSASAALQQAELVARTLPDTAAYYEILNLLGVVAHDRGDMELAAQYFSRVLAWASRREDQSDIAGGLTNLANTMVGFDPKAALEYHQRALRTWKELNHSFGVATALYSIGSIKKNFGLHDEAAAAFKDALALFEQLGFASRVLIAATGYAATLQKLDRHDEAIPILLRSIELARDIKDSAVEGNVHINLARAYEHVRDMDKAATHAATAYDIAQKNGTLEDVMRSEILLSDLARKAGRHEEAHAYYRRYIATRDSVQGQETQKTIHTLREKYEAEAREREIGLLRKDSGMQSVLLASQQNELALQKAEAGRRTQLLRLVEQEREIDRLELQRRDQELQLERSDNQKQAQKLLLLSKDRQLKETLLDRQVMLRNSLIAGLALLMILSAVSISRYRSRQKLNESLVREAQLMARAAETESVRLVAEKERQEKVLQQSLSRRLIESQEQERKRIAGELHDSLGQGLLVIRNRAFMAKEWLTDTERLGNQLDIIAETAGSTLAEVRQISRALRPYQLDRFGLTAAIEGLTGSIGETSSIRFVSEIEGIDGSFSPAAEINVFRVIQEAIANILKHADATHASLRIQRSNQHVTIEIGDNGRGFSVEEMRGTPSTVGAGLGLRSMIERVHILEGTMTIESVPGNGTTLHIELPVAQADSEERAATTDRQEGAPAEVEH